MPNQDERLTDSNAWDPSLVHKPNLCTHDFGGVWWHDEEGQTKTGRQCRICGQMEVPSSSKE